MAAVIVVLGAAGGIGSVLCKQLTDRGEKVVAAGRTQHALDELAAAIGCISRTVDATNLDDVDRLIKQTTDECGQVDGIVNCVGSLLLKPAHLTSADEWADTLHTNLTSSFSVVRAAGRHMRDSGGAVVLMSSAAARIGLANHEAIAAAKAGIIGLSRSAAASYARAGIRFNVVAPGLVATKLTERITKSDAGRKASIDMHALGRLGTPEDVASAVAWLLDGNNDWITGQVLGADGGLATVRA